MKEKKLLGGILLIVGTSIGGGMLALPVSTAPVGFTNSIFFLIFCWLIMTMGALLVLEVNVRLPIGSNMISMAKATLGMPGQIIAWIAYLLLLYTLLSGYISGGSDVLQGLLKYLHLTIPDSVSALLFTSLFGLAVYHGIQTVDYLNRGLMFGKLGIYLILVLIMSPHVDFSTFSDGSFKAITGSLMILITSFGFASIVPSLREYFNDDIKALRQVILLGSLIPLSCYIIWNAVIMGIVAREGAHGLIALNQAQHMSTELTQTLSNTVNSNLITVFFNFFTSICMATAFLGVSLGLFDFLSDGLKLKKKGWQGKLVLALAFVPPLLIVIFNPGIYLHALSYAGICCVILLLLLPAIMSWRGRMADSAAHTSVILVPGGYMMLSLIIVVALYLLSLSI